MKRLLLAAALAAAACNNAPAAAPPQATPLQTTTGVPQMDGAAVMAQLTDALNAGDADRASSLIAPDARFDSVGRIYESRDEIMSRFLGPEVIAAGGHYQQLSVTSGSAGRTVVEYQFTTRGGGTEHFTYDRLVSDGLIRDCVGRYVSSRASRPPTASPAVEEAVQAYVDAVNAESLDQLVAAFAPDATVIDVTRRITGSEAIRAWAEREVMGGRLAVLEVVATRGDGQRLRVHWAPAGSDGWDAFYDFTVAGGRIVLADLQYA